MTGKWYVKERNKHLLSVLVFQKKHFLDIFIQSWDGILVIKPNLWIDPLVKTLLNSIVCQFTVYLDSIDELVIKKMISVLTKSTTLPTYIFVDICS